MAQGRSPSSRTQPCTRCGTTQVEYLIGRDGRARRLGTLSLGYHQTFTPAIGSTAGWVYTWPHRGPCSLALEPGSHKAVTVPCGGLSAVSSAGVLIGNGSLVDPSTGHVRLRVKAAELDRADPRHTRAREQRPVGRPDEPRARRPAHGRAPPAGLAEPAALRLPVVPRAARPARRTAVRPAVVSAEPGRGRLDPQHEHRQPHGGAGLPGARAPQVLDDRAGRPTIASSSPRRGPSAPWSASGVPGSARWRCAPSPRCTATRRSYRSSRDARRRTADRRYPNG